MTVAQHGAPPTSLAMARNVVDLRLDRLHHTPLLPSTARRIVSCGLAAVAATTLPFMTGTGILLAAALLDYPLG